MAAGAFADMGPQIIDCEKGQEIGAFLGRINTINDPRPDSSTLML